MSVKLTSLLAWNVTKFRMGSLQEQVLKLLTDAPQGLTHEEVAELLSDTYTGSQSGPRQAMRMLEIAGYVYDTGMTRMTSRTHQAIIWKSFRKGVE